MAYDGWGGSNINRISLDIITNGAIERSFKFAVNPQSYKESHQVRTYLQQTRTANTVQRFGEGPATIEIAGHFGDREQGYDYAMFLRNELITYLEKFSDNNPVDSAMAFRNYTLNDYWYVEPAPNGFTISIDAKSPTLIQYAIQFYVVGDLTRALPGDRTEANQGNDKANADAGKGNTNPHVPSNSAKERAHKKLGRALDFDFK